MSLALLANSVAFDQSKLPGGKSRAADAVDTSWEAERSSDGHRQGAPFFCGSMDVVTSL